MALSKGINVRNRVYNIPKKYSYLFPAGVKTIRDSDISSFYSGSSEFMSSPIKAFQNYIDNLISNYNNNSMSPTNNTNPIKPL